MSARPNRSRSHAQHLSGAGVLDRGDARRVNASHWRSSPCARAASMSSDWLPLKSAAASAGESLAAGRRRRRDIGHHLLHTPGEELVLLVRPQAELDGASGGAEVGDGLTELAEPRAVEHLARRLLDGELREGRGIRPLELLRVVAQQALADELQEDVVVALERGVDVEVLVRRPTRRFSAMKPEPPHASRPPAAVSRAFHVESGLSAAARVSRSSRSRPCRCLPLKTASNFCSSSSCAKN